jgi:mannitol/fructose-specific phosphotransferase system IIA component (Ntr-type)
VQRLIGVCGQQRGIDFNSLDGEKVQLVLLISPRTPGDHLQALGKFLANCATTRFTKFLKQATEVSGNIGEAGDNNGFIPRTAKPQST